MEAIASLAQKAVPAAIIKPLVQKN